MLTGWGEIDDGGWKATFPAGPTFNTLIAIAFYKILVFEKFGDYAYWFNNSVAVISIMIPLLMVSFIYNGIARRHPEAMMYGDDVVINYNNNVKATLKRSLIAPFVEEVIKAALFLNSDTIFSFKGFIDIAGFGILEWAEKDFELAGVLPMIMHAVFSVARIQGDLSLAILYHLLYNLTVFAFCVDAQLPDKLAYLHFFQATSKELIDATNLLFSINNLMVIYDYMKFRLNKLTDWKSYLSLLWVS